jgi:multidrug efflux system outer membrane protein
MSLNWRHELATAGLIGLLALSGVAQARGHRETPPPAVPLPSAYQPAPQRTDLAPAALDRWWLLFNDPALDALENEAGRGSSDARILMARIDETRATRLAQRARTLPTGSITGAASHQKAYDLGGGGNGFNPSSGVTDAASGNFPISWELDLFGRLATARRVADADAARARFNIEGGWASLAADVADTWFQARGLAAELEDARQTARIQEDLLAVAQRRAAVGAGPADDVDRVAGQLAQARARTRDLEAKLDDSRRQLLILVGRDLAGPMDVETTAETTMPPSPPRVLPADLLARRPDVREAEYRLKGELGAARLAHLAVFPTVTLLPALGVSSVAAPGVSFIPPTTFVTARQTTTAGFWSLGASVNVPTLDVPRLLDEARAEDSRSRQAALAYEKVVRTAYGEAQGALSDLAAGEQATGLLIDGEARARRAYDGARRRYAQGLDDLTAMLGAEQTWRSVRTDLTTERTDTLRRAVRTYKALGGGWNFTGAGGV